LNLSQREESFERRFREKLAPTLPTRPYPGLAVCLLIAVCAVYFHTLPFSPFTLSTGQHPVSDVLLALVLGMVLRNTLLGRYAALLRPGIQMAVKTILTTGIFLLGASLDVYEVLAVGAQIIVDSVVVIVVMLPAVYFIARWMGVDEKQGLLLGVGNAICGNAAIVALSPMIRAEDRDIALTIAIVNLMGIAAMVLFPIVGAVLALAPSAYGIWCGLSIQVTAHVIAAGFAHPVDGQLAGQVATITKLTRISFLGPAIFLVGFLYTWRNRKRDPIVGAPMRFSGFVPWFVVGFFVLAVLRTFGCLPEITFHLTDRFPWGQGDYTLSVADVIDDVAVWLITCGMAGVGLMTEFRMVREGGAKPVFAGFVAAALVFGLGFALSGVK